MAAVFCIRVYTLYTRIIAFTFSHRTVVRNADRDPKRHQRRRRRQMCVVITRTRFDYNFHTLHSYYSMYSICRICASGGHTVKEARPLFVSHFCVAACCRVCRGHRQRDLSMNDISHDCIMYNMYMHEYKTLTWIYKVHSTFRTLDLVGVLIYSMVSKRLRCVQSTNIRSNYTRGSALVPREYASSTFNCAARRRRCARLVNKQGQRW